MRTTIFMTIEEGKEAEIHVTKTKEGNRGMFINAGSIKEALEQVKDAEQLSDIELVGSEEHTTDKHYVISPISEESANYFINAICAREPGYEKENDFVHALDRAKIFASKKHNGLKAHQAKVLVLPTYLGDPYQTIIDAYSFGYHRGYKRAKREARKGE